MLIRNKRSWEIPESQVTPESLYFNRRRFLAASAALAAAGGSGFVGADAARASQASQDDPSAHLYPVPNNPAYTAERAIAPEDISSRYNNFYEFNSRWNPFSKDIADAAQELPLRPWEIRIEGEVEEPFTIGMDELLGKVTLEERIYRHRCVEAWSMVIPWSGFAMRELVQLARPLSSAKHVYMETFFNPGVAPGQKNKSYPWPYREGVTMAEATNELAFLVTGVYNKPALKQYGAPLRLALPWKYGFKSIKSIVRFRFDSRQPQTFWHDITPNEYGYWANVNPEVKHPRWSQATERDIGTGERHPTLLFNGYGEQVAHLYDSEEMKNLGDRLYR